MIVKLLTERHLEFLSLKEGCTGSSESTLVKMSNCWKSHDMAHLVKLYTTVKVAHHHHHHRVLIKVQQGPSWPRILGRSDFSL